MAKKKGMSNPEIEEYLDKLDKAREVAMEASLIALNACEALLNALDREGKEKELSIPMRDIEPAYEMAKKAVRLRRRGKRLLGKI